MTSDDPFDALLAGHSPAIQQLARAARDQVLQVKPDAAQQVETSWGGYLLFKQSTTVCWLSVHKKHVSLGFSQGAALPDPAGLLEGSGKHQRHVKLKKLDDLKSPALKTLLQAAWERQPEADQLQAALQRIREICLALPDTSEKLSHDHPTFFAGKKSFAVYGLYSPSIAFKAAPMFDPDGDPRFFPTPYMAHNGWWSLRIDSDTDWDQARALLQQSYEQVAPRRKR